MAWINIAVLLPNDIVNSQLVFINLFLSANTTPQDHFACTTVRVCCKMAKTAAIQDTLMHVVKTVGLWCLAARDAGASAEDLQAVNAWTLQATLDVCHAHQCQLLQRTHCRICPTRYGNQE